MTFPDDRLRMILEGDRLKLVDIVWILGLFLFIPIILLSEVGYFIQWLYMKSKGV